MTSVFKECGITPIVEFDGEVGDRVLIATGTFSGQEGTIDSIDQEKQKVVVLVEVFGRLTPNELGFADVKKLYK